MYLRYVLELVTVTISDIGNVAEVVQVSPSWKGIKPVESEI
jgi:hypothetical protein